MADKNLTITGLQEAQRANLHNIQAMRPTGALGRAIRWGGTEAHRYAVFVTHVDTGALRASHRIKVETARAEVYIDPNAINPRGQRPADYGVVEHERGGGHAFYDRTENERGPFIVQRMREMIVGALR